MLTRKVSVLVAAIAILGMGATTAGCASHTEKAPTSSAVNVVPTEKGCLGGPGSVHDSPGCAGKHHNANGPHRGNKAHKAGSGVVHNGNAGRHASRGGTHHGGGHGGGHSGGGRGHK